MWFLERIPKIMNFYWGNEKLPFFRFMTYYSFAKYNPDWKIKIFIPRFLTKLENSTVKFIQSQKDYFPRLTTMKNVEIIEKDFGNFNHVSESHKSDYIRWEILYKEGGAWADSDILFLRSMDDLFINKESNRQCTFMNIEYPGGGCKPIGFLLGSQNNKFYRYLYEVSTRILENYTHERTDYQDIGTKIFSKIKTEEIQRIFFQVMAYQDFKCVYNYIWNRMRFLFFEDHSQEFIGDKNILGIHWYGGSIEARSFTDTANDTNYKEFKNTFSTLIERIYND